MKLPIFVILVAAVLTLNARAGGDESPEAAQLSKQLRPLARLLGTWQTAMSKMT